MNICDITSCEQAISVVPEGYEGALIIFSTADPGGSVILTKGNGAILTFTDIGLTGALTLSMTEYPNFFEAEGNPYVVQVNNAGSGNNAEFAGVFADGATCFTFNVARGITTADVIIEMNEEAA